MVDRVSQAGRSLQVVQFDPWLTRDGRQAGEIFGVRAIPAWYVYDGHGKLVLAEVGSWGDAQLDAALKEHGI